MTSFKPSPVAQALQQRRLQELMDAENQLSNELIAHLGYSRELVGEGWRGFAAWCKQLGVNFLPARPTTVAAYILNLHRFGKPWDEIIKELSAIADLHDQNVGNPVATGLVNAALASIAEPGQVTPPHSWKKEEAAMFWFLPAVVQSVIKRRDKERERHLHNQGNELGELRKKVRQHEIQNKADSGKDSDAKNASDAKPDQGAGAVKADNKIPDEQRDSLEHQLWSPAPRRSGKNKQRARA